MKVILAYDHGRGIKGLDFTKEITIAVIPEASLREGKPTHQRYIVSKLIGENDRSRIKVRKLGHLHKLAA